MGGGMEVAFLMWCLLAGAISLAVYSFLSSTWQHRLSPPGPFPLPIVGNLFQLRGMPHRALTGLSEIHGPLMSLKLGLSNTVVISSAEVASEVILKNDLAFSGRAVPDSLRVLRHDELSVVWIPPLQQWRDLRRIYNNELFTPQKLDANRGLRIQKVREMLQSVGRSCHLGQAIDIGEVAFSTTFDLISNTVFSLDVVGFDSDSSQEFKQVAWTIMDEAGKPNISDFFPLLRFIDPWGNRRRQKKQFQKLHDIFDELIKKRQSSMLEGEAESDDVLDAFLRSKIDIQSMKAAFVDIFIAGSETSSNTVEWAMAELLHNPSAMAKAQSELHNSIPQGKEVDESDIPQLPYLQAVVKETLRLHPQFPLHVPRRTETEVQLCGYTVPKHTKVLFNTWAIGRDASTWPDPDSFQPERFLQAKDVDFRGKNFELMPFGAGRRICPGLPLAFRMLHLILASLVRYFHWKLPDGMTPGEMDLTEKVGLTMRLAKPLVLVPIKQWRDLRRIYNNELFTPQKLDANRGLRIQKVREVLQSVGRSCQPIAGRARQAGLSKLR